MTKTTIAIFQISTEEDLRFQLDFLGLDLTGRTLKVNVRRRDTNALVQALTAPSNMTLVGSGNLTVFYPRASMSAWAKTEYEADVVDETGGSATRIMAVRFVYDEPGKLVYGVRGNQATVTFADNQATVTAIGGVGPPGPANVITIGDVETLETGEEATASLSGAAPTQVLNLGLPKGNTGTAATIAVGAVTTVAPGEDAAVTNSGTSGAAVFAFEIPSGAAGTITIGDVDTGAPGTPAEVENVGSSSEAVLNFTIPAGLAATIAVGDVATGLPGSDAEVTNVGTVGDAILEFIIPRGDQGPPGSVVDGDKGDIVVSGGGTVWTIEGGVITTDKIEDDAVTVDKIADPDLKAIAGLIGAANKLPYFTGSGAADLADLTVQARIFLAAPTTAVQRAAIGVLKKKLADDAVAGAAVTAIVLDLQGCSKASIEIDIIPNSGVADFGLYWQGSTDGGATWVSSPGAYFYILTYTNGVGTALSTSPTADGALDGTFIDTATAVVFAKYEISFTNGNSFQYPRLHNKSSVYDGATYNLTNSMSQRQSGGAFTHLRFISSVAGGIGVNSRLVAEGV